VKLASLAALQLALATGATLVQLFPDRVRQQSIVLNLIDIATAVANSTRHPPRAQRPGAHRHPLGFKELNGFEHHNPSTAS
jgi:hypothetical protein